jgi:pilus assembly protein CpaC
MRIRTEVSQPDATIGFTPFAGASIIPGFTRRAAVSEVTVQPNGTIALGGLISTTNRKLVEKVPLLSDIPVLGSLFTSKRYQNDQTDLVVFVTPKVLPNPLPPGQTAPAGVVAAGNTTNASTVLGNPGIPGFSGFITGAGNGGGTGGSQ